MMIGQAGILSRVDDFCPYCQSFIPGRGVWHNCVSDTHGLMIVPSGQWAVTADQVNYSQGVTLLPWEYDQLLAKVTESGSAVLVIDHYYMDKERLDYSWLYDTVGLNGLMGE